MQCMHGRGEVQHSHAQFDRKTEAACPAAPVVGSNPDRGCLKGPCRSRGDLMRLRHCTIEFRPGLSGP